MNEKRFFTKINKNGRLVIIDKECHIELIDLTLACEVLNRLDLKLKTYNEQLGEQQATITKLKELNGDKGKRIISLIRTNKTLKEENEQLRQSVEYWQKKYEEGTETFQID